MVEMNTLDYDIVPTGRGIHIECHNPEKDCSIACLRNMCGLRYEEAIPAGGSTKSIVIELAPECDYQMPRGLYVVAFNVCRLCRANKMVKGR